MHDGRIWRCLGVAMIISDTLDPREPHNAKQANQVLFRSHEFIELGW